MSQRSIELLAQRTSDPGRVALEALCRERRGEPSRERLRLDRGQLHAPVQLEPLAHRLQFRLHLRLIERRSRKPLSRTRHGTNVLPPTAPWLCPFLCLRPSRSLKSGTAASTSER